MSRVIPSHVLHVGQSIRITSQKEPPSGCPISHSRSPSCSYFTTERWVDPPLMEQSDVTGRTMPFRVPPSPNPVHRETRTTTHDQSNGHPYLTMEKTRQPNQPAKEAQPEASQHIDLMSPSLDISIDHLNQLILELDPTFQPLSFKTNAPAASTPGWTATTRGQGFDFSDGRRDGEQSARAWCEEANRRAACTIPVAPPSSSRSECILVSRAAPGGNCTASGSVIFSDSSRPSGHGGATGQQSGHRLPSTSGSTSRSHPSSEYAPSMHQDHAPMPLLFSLGHKGPSLPLHIPGKCDRSSAVSMMSTSPGSDTSYMLGSTQSLLSDSPDQVAGRFTDSPFGSVGTFSNLNSPFVSSPTVQKNFFSDQNAGVGGPGQQHPNIPYKMSACALLSKKDQASSCPPSIANSTTDIPILLVNGCLEQGDRHGYSSRANHNMVKRRVSSSCNSGSGIGTLSKTSSDSRLYSTDNPVSTGQPTMKFVTDTSKYWFRPHLTRDQVVELLTGKEPGAFVIRDSTSFRGSFGLAMKVPFTPSTAHNQSGDESSDHIRHFLIESSPKGVHVKGASDEPYFGSLSALVYQHAIMPLSLPCKLAIPTKDFSDSESSPESSPESAVHELKRMAACNVFYLTSVTMETLTGCSAVQKAVSTTLQMETLPTPTIVHFKVTEQGITLTDVQRKIFFRRHYPLATISFCGLDPQNRQWQKHCRSSRIFGFVAKSQTDSKDNTCHLFAEYDVVQPVSPVIGLMESMLQSA